MGDSKVGLASPCALAELAVGRKVNWKSVADREAFVQKTLGALAARRRVCFRGVMARDHRVARLRPRRCRAAGLLLAAALAAGACHDAVLAPEAVVPHPLTPADDGRSVDLRTGAALRIRLPENPSTGYVWRLELDMSHLRLEREGFEQRVDRVGGGGERTRVLRATAPGVTTVKLMLWRPWEGERAAIRHFAVTRHITPRSRHPPGRRRLGTPDRSHVLVPKCA